jgi:hypothetical protein
MFILEWYSEKDAEHQKSLYERDGCDVVIYEEE